MSKYVPTYYDKVCAICNKDFTTTRNRSKYCSPECAKEGAIKMTELNKRARRKARGAYDDKICEACGKRYKPNSNYQKYCHPDCKKETAKKAERKNLHLINLTTMSSCPWHNGLIEGTARNVDPVLGF